MKEELKKSKSVFDVLSAIDCSKYIEKKERKSKKTGRVIQLSYLSWAWAWSLCKKYYPDATYTIYESDNHIPYFTDGKTCWVKTGVTIEGQEYIEYLPILDNSHDSIPLNDVTSFDMNASIQRSLTKALARHGLGLYIYAGEDLPETVTEKAKAEVKEQQQTLESLEQKNEKDMKALLDKIAKAKTAKECEAIWPQIKERFANGTDYFKTLRLALAQRGGELKAAEEAAAKDAQPTLEDMNFEQIK